MQNNDLVKEWAELAFLDFKSAEFLLQMKPLPLEIICYHCQQAAEKYLKGFIAKNGGKIQKIHDLTILNKECCKYDERFKQIEDECIDLTDYASQIRYPFHIDLEEADIKIAIKNIKQIISFMEDKL